MTYGVQPTGYVRKPLSVILAELEAAMITEFGPGVIQTSQSPLGQLNGLMADLIAQIDETNLDLYQSYDPDQAEGNRLDILARLRLLSRGQDTDAELRKAITNEGQARVDVQDLIRAIKSLDGVSYAQVFLNETGEVSNNDLEKGTVALSVIGGDDEEIALAMRQYIVPGVNTYGNTYVTSTVEGFCRSMSIIRPVEVDVSLTVNVSLTNDKFNCPPPALAAIKSYLEDAWAQERINGLDPSFYSIRSIIERQFGNVEVISIYGERDDIIYGKNVTVPVGFTEIASITATVVEV